MWPGVSVEMYSFPLSASCSVPRLCQPRPTGCESTIIVYKGNKAFHSLSNIVPVKKHIFQICMGQKNGHSVNILETHFRESHGPEALKISTRFTNIVVWTVFDFQVDTEDNCMGGSCVPKTALAMTRGKAIMVREKIEKNNKCITNCWLVTQSGGHM